MNWPSFAPVPRKNGISSPRKGGGGDLRASRESAEAAAGTGALRRSRKLEAIESAPGGGPPGLSEAWPRPGVQARRGRQHRERLAPRPWRASTGAGGPGRGRPRGSRMVARKPRLRVRAPAQRWPDRRGPAFRDQQRDPPGRGDPPRRAPHLAATSNGHESTGQLSLALTTRISCGPDVAARRAPGRAGGGRSE